MITSDTLPLLACLSQSVTSPSSAHFSGLSHLPFLTCNERCTALMSWREGGKCFGGPRRCAQLWCGVPLSLLQDGPTQGQWPIDNSSYTHYEFRVISVLRDYRQGPPAVSCPLTIPTATGKEGMRESCWPLTYCEVMASAATP
ncbi:hypothetical protein RRG08_040208 [Elysia crispata]|uniref:Uncharacterized protein n=1 Tax=Elysia crispata TaxID=231223 RepID=A0AAE0XX43_9GAST|nr:hypothetical protein RRG08_040208 [Elysia crispata]